jgi:hypothetical protein
VTIQAKLQELELAAAVGADTGSPPPPEKK